MEKWRLRPLVSIGPIKFGMDRAKVREQFPGKYTEFKKNKFSKNTTDVFGSVHVYYSPENCVEAVEIFGGVEVELDGKIIFPSELKYLRTAIPDLTMDGDIYMQINKSIGVYAPNESVESVLAGCKGYYA